MTGYLSVAMGVAVLAALRATWSPCGESMLTRTSPPAERGRAHRSRRPPPVATRARAVAGSPPCPRTPAVAANLLDEVTLPTLVPSGVDASGVQLNELAPAATGMRS